jgi:glycosyltransferase involved in cell wall biosynthesis
MNSLHEGLHSMSSVKAIIAADMPPLKVGSLEVCFAAVKRFLEERGCDVGLWFGGAISPSVQSYFGVSNDSIVVDLGALDSPVARARWCERLRKASPDYLWLTFFPCTGVLPWQIRRACPRSRICISDQISRGYPRRSLLRRVRRRAVAFLSRGCVDEFIAVSEFVARRMSEVDYISAEKIHVIYNTVDLARFAPATAPGSGIACVCHMDESKGARVLLQSLVILKNRGQEPESRFVGEGPRLDEYRRFARDHGLRATFLGMRDDVPDILRGAMLTVVPSTWPEAFGLAAAESEAAGVPVIASRVGGLPEVVEDGVTGVLVPPGDSVALADAISSLLQDPQRCQAMGAAGRRRAEEHFDLSRTAAAIADIVIGSKGRGQLRSVAQLDADFKGEL